MHTKNTTETPVEIAVSIKFVTSMLTDSPHVQTVYVYFMKKS